MVAYQLPLNVTRAAEGGFEVEWDHEHVLNKSGLNLGTRVLWVGCIGLQVDADEEEDLAELLLEQYDCVVVFLNPTVQADFYHGFCRG